MNNRKRKKWLKQHGEYIKDFEVYELYYSLCEWIIPRLKKFKQINIAYPGVSPWETPEKWDAALDKLIETFELLKTDPIDYMPDYDKWDNELWKKVSDDYYQKVEEGLELFKRCFLYLWI